MLVIFDLDGTLLNTIADLGEACNHALSACGLPTHRREEYPRLVGNGVKKLIERALPKVCREQGEMIDSAGQMLTTQQWVDRVAEVFIPYYDEHNCDYTTPYDGISELLDTLKSRGYRLAVASNKYQVATEKIVGHFFPNVFDVVLGERVGVPRKPDEQIVRDIEGVVGECASLYVGDSLVDRDTARNACVPFVACSWGFVSRDVLANAEIQTIIDRPQELLKVKTEE